MSTKDWIGTAAEQWATAGEFNPALQPSDASEPYLLADLSSAPRYVPPEQQIQLAFFEGLLAVHYGGAFTALMHAFHRPWEKNKNALIWAEEEPVRCPPHIRAYPPIRVSNNRFILFSNPCAVFIADVWMLSGWAFMAGDTFQTVLDVRAKDLPKVAAPPVPLQVPVEKDYSEEPAQREPDLAGILLESSSGPYQWAVLDLEDLSNNSSTADILAQAVDLPLEGSPCQVDCVSGQLVAFATPRGHWLWNVPDARTGNVDALKRSLSVDGTNTEVRLNQEVLSSKAFRLRRQVLFHDPSNDEYCFWYYLKESGRSTTLERYRINFDSLSFHDSVPVDDKLEAVPVGGLCDRDTAEMLFASNNRLYQEGHGVLSTAVGIRPIPDLNELMGLTFSSPLLAGVRNHAREIWLRNVRGDLDAYISTSTLFANPVIWSNWMFTCELEENHLLIRRWEIETVAVQDTG